MLRRLIRLLIVLAAGAFAWSLIVAERQHRRGSGGGEPPPERAREADSGAEEPAPGRCEAITGSGRRCSREAEPGSSFCWQHQG